jgi:hypothetical protein
MKNYSWIVEVKNPTENDNVLWKCVAETLEKVAKNWNEETKNNYLTYSRLHNIYHKRNIKDFNIISVKKVNECLETCLETQSSS